MDRRRALRFERRARRQPRRDGAAGREAIASRTGREWLGQLEAAGIPAGPINRISQALADVQAQHRQMVRAIAGVPAGRLAGPARRRPRGFGPAAAARSASIPARYSPASEFRPPTSRGSSPAAWPASYFRLAGARDQQVELVLAAVLDQHLGRADEVGRDRLDGDDVQAALVAGFTPFDLILRAGLDRQRRGPGRERLARGPTQLLALPSADRI